MNVLLAVDHSKCSEAALDEVLNRTWPEDTHFHVLSIVEPFYPDYGWYDTFTPTLYEAEQEHVRQTCQFVESVAKRLGEKLGSKNITSECSEGFIAEQILAKAKQWPADLIVLGSHERKGLAKWLLGSVSQAVSVKAPCSVEIIKMNAAAGGTRKAG